MIKQMDIVNLIAKSSLHLLISNPNTMTPESFGSGCIVFYKDRYFLLSVSHVTDLENAAVFIETNQPPNEDLQTPLYGVGQMCYFDEFTVPNDKLNEINNFEDLTNFPSNTLDITFCEIKQNVTFLQPEWNFGYCKIEKGDKVFLNLDLAGTPTPGKLFGFCGRVRQKIEGMWLKSQPTLKLDLEFDGTRGDFHQFISPEIIVDADDYRGCSGSPILDEDGKLVALTSSVMEGGKLIFGFSIEKCKQLLDLAIQSNML
jgi:hypothetical protein